MTIVVDASAAPRRCFELNGSGSGRRIVAIGPSPHRADLVIAEITNATWKFVIFYRMAAEPAISAVREVVKAFEELVPTSVLRDRALCSFWWSLSPGPTLKPTYARLWHPMLLGPPSRNPGGYRTYLLFEGWPGEE
jgi:hypothetical protein